MATMTTRSDLKKRVRDRQAKTGESYTTARAHVTGAFPSPNRERVERISAVVLRCNDTSVRIRIPGETESITLRCASDDAWTLKPGQIVRIRLAKRWTWDGNGYISGEVEHACLDVKQLGLQPLKLEEQGTYDLDQTYEPFPPEDPYHELWSRAAAEPRKGFEFEAVAWGADIFPDDPDVVARASHMADTGQARDLLMDVLLADLRCIDAHVHLGNQRFDDFPEHAIQHYEIALAIGDLSLGPAFTGILPWGCLYNRPYLRAMHAYGLCLWRRGDADEAQRVFLRTLELDPADNQGVRYCWDDIRQGLPWRPRA